tara:strand:+ start:197 stop:916 length:720 start_codon:yes stop_codon:yes gene_type:complete
MKKLILISLLSLGLIGCASLELEFSTSPAEAEIKRILALGLTHTENLSEARKLTNPVLVSEVVQELNTRNDNALIEAENVAKYAEKVKVSDNNSDNQIKFTGPEIYESDKVGILDNYDYKDYFLLGWKDKNNGLMRHQLHLSIKYTSDNWRNYYSASFCDKWQGCSDEDQIDITLINRGADSCSASICDFTEIMKLNLSEDFLRSNMETGFSIRFNSIKAKNKITISSEYTKGYLKVAK